MLINVSIIVRSDLTPMTTGLRPLKLTSYKIPEGLMKSLHFIHESNDSRYILSNVAIQILICYVDLSGFFWAPNNYCIGLVFGRKMSMKVDQ